MRIRKYAARLSALSLSTDVWISPSNNPPAAAALLPSLLPKCELNMSPWDAMALAPQLDYSYLLQYQVDGDDKVTSNVGRGESVTPTESDMAWSGKQYCEEKVKKEIKVKEEEEEVVEENDGDEKISSLLNRVAKKRARQTANSEFDFVCCIKSDGKGWQCKNEAKESHSLCEHHLNQLKSYSQSSQKPRVQRVSKKSNPLKVSATMVPRGRKARKKTDSPEFYYYSGFGPLWGRKRAIGNRRDCKNGSNGEIMDDVGEFSHISSACEYVEDIFDDSTDDDDDNGANDGYRKRCRRPIKARSLKSLL